MAGSMDIITMDQYMAEAQFLKEKAFFDKLAKAEIPEVKLVAFFAKNPAPTDKQFHEWATSQGYNEHRAEEGAYKLLGSLFKGLDGKAVKYPEGALEKGTKVEMEHTNSKLIAMKIALDHLKEDPKYYDKLELIHEESD